MKRFLPLCAFLFALCPFKASAILDSENGMSDVWELRFNNDNLFPLNSPDFTASADPDSDGWTNEQESVAETDPFDATSPNGFVRPEVVILHDVTLDLDHDEIPEFYAEVATISWPVIPGKQYTLLASPNLTSWIQVEQSTNVTDATWTYNFPITNDEPLFWSVRIEDVDSDGDGLTDAEEYELGMNPGLVDTNGNGIPDKLDTTILHDSPQFADADGDGIPDVNDSQPNTPRGASPTISSQTATGNPVINVLAGDKLTFLVTVTNPAGSPASGSNLTLFVNETKIGATITKVADNQFSICLDAKTHAKYPDEILQNIAVRFRDAQYATTWLSLARCDVAEWEGRIAGIRTGSDSWEDATILIHSHYGGSYCTPEFLGGFGNVSSLWYRGPRTVPILDQSGEQVVITDDTDTEANVQIGDSMRYPLVLYSGANFDCQVIDISDPVAFPNCGCWYNNVYPKTVHVTAPGDESIPTGETCFYPFPDNAVINNFNMTPFVCSYIDNNVERLIHEGVYRVIRDSDYRRMHFSNFTETDTRAKVTSHDLDLYLYAKIVPYTAGFLDYPGLPIDNGPIFASTLPMCSEQWHKIVVKVGPDSAAVSSGFGIWLRRGGIGDENPQSGFTVNCLDPDGKFKPLAVPADGKISILPANTELFSQLSGPKGLTLFIKRAPSVSLPHYLSLELLKTNDPVPAPSHRITRIDLQPFDLNSDLNNDGNIDVADSQALSKAMEPGATSEDKEKAIEYILPDNSMSNGAWDIDDLEGNVCFSWPSYGNMTNAPVAGEMNDDAIAIEVKTPTYGVAWFTHEAIEDLDFFTDKECQNRIDIDFDHPFDLSDNLPERLWVAVKAGYTGNSGETVEGILTLHVGESTSQEWAKKDLPLTVVPDFGCKKFFEAARNYIFERNTQLLVWDYYMPDRIDPVQLFRLCVMREEATTVKGYDAFANSKKGIGAVALAAGVNWPTVMINGNQCFFWAGYDESSYMDLPFMALSIADACHGRVIISGATAGISSNNFDTTTKPARGSDLAGPDPIPVGTIAGSDGIRGTADDIANPNAGNPGGKFFSLTGTTWNFAAGQATGADAIGGLSSNYASSVRSDKAHQMVGRVACREPGKGCIFTATEIVGVGQAPAFAAAAKRSGNQMLNPSTDTLAQELFILDSGAGSLALDHIDPTGNLREAYLGRKSATGLPYYVNNYVQFWATEPRP